MFTYLCIAFITICCLLPYPKKFKLHFTFIIVISCYSFFPSVQKPTNSFKDKAIVCHLHRFSFIECSSRSNQKVPSMGSFKLAVKSYSIFMHTDQYGCPVTHQTKFLACTILFIFLVQGSSYSDVVSLVIGILIDCLFSCR